MTLQATDITTLLIENTGAILVTFITAFFGLLGIIYGKRADTQEKGTQKEATITDSWAQLTRRLDNEIKRLDHELQTRDLRLNLLETQVSLMAAREQQMLTDLKHIHDWAEQGATPPPPARPHYLN